MNEHDSEKIAGIFNNDGMSKSDDLDNADVLFVNTCTIRENADDKLYGTLGHLKKWKSLSPNRRLLVGGCAAQKDKELVLHLPLQLNMHLQSLYPLQLE